MIPFSRPIFSDSILYPRQNCSKTLPFTAGHTYSLHMGVCPLPRGTITAALSAMIVVQGEESLLLPCPRARCSLHSFACVLICRYVAYVPVNCKSAILPSPRANFRAFDFFGKISVKFPAMLVVNTVKCPTD